MELVKGTKIYAADGALKPIEEVKVGDSVMAADGSARIVTEVSCAVEEMYELVQRTFHRAHKEDTSRPLPFDVIKITCSSSQVVMVSSRLVSGLYLERVNPAVPKVKNQTEELLSCETTLACSETSIEDGYLDMLCADEDTIAEIEEVDDGRISTLEWPAKVGDFDTMISNVRFRTRLQLLPFTFVHPIMRKQLSEMLNRDVSAAGLGSMAWLLGFWLGDGYKRHVVFALNKEDHDVNSKLNTFTLIDVVLSLKDLEQESNSSGNSSTENTSTQSVGVSSTSGNLGGSTVGTIRRSSMEKLTLKIRPDQNTMGALGSLHKVTPTRNLLIIGNTFW